MPQGKGTYGTQVGRPSKKKKYQAGGSIDPFSSKNPEGIAAEKEMEAIEKMNMQGRVQNAIPTTNAMDRSQTSPMGNEVGTGVYKKGGQIGKMAKQIVKGGKGKDVTDIVKAVGKKRKKAELESKEPTIFGWRLKKDVS